MNNTDSATENFPAKNVDLLLSINKHTAEYRSLKATDLRANYVRPTL